jgi:hypothetical protein
MLFSYSFLTSTGACRFCCIVIENRGVSRKSFEKIYAIHGRLPEGPGLDIEKATRIHSTLTMFADRASGRSIHFANIYLRKESAA